MSQTTSFFILGYATRLQLVVLVHNRNIGCEQATTENRRSKYEVNYSQVTENWFPRLIFRDREKQYAPEILTGFWNFCSSYKHTHMVEVIIYLRKHSCNPSKEKPGKELIIQSKT